MNPVLPGTLTNWLVTNLLSWFCPVISMHTCCYIQIKDETGSKVWLVIWLTLNKVFRSLLKPVCSFTSDIKAESLIPSTVSIIC